MSLLYRSDIDGLRAIAVLIVVLFHAFPPLIPGGYLGVDVFFVISGFLISKIISNNAHNNTFSFFDFYSRRIKRIFPALLTVLTTSFLVGWFILLPDEFQQLGKHIASSIGFVQNFTLLNEAGYFDTSTDKKPLMHLWSLAVEEQFYLIYPLIYWLNRKIGAAMLKSIALLAIASLASNIFLSKTDPTASFFLPYTRIWEILIGAGLSFIEPNANSIKNKITSRCLAALGLFCILIPAWAPDEIKIPHHWLSLSAALGAALIIYTGSNNQNELPFLSTPIMRFIGRHSYPLYLWHWPIISLIIITEGRSAPAFHFIFAIIISFALAIFTSALIENRIRFNKGRFIPHALLITGFLIGLVGYNTYSREGLSFRMKTKLPPSNQFDALKHNSFLAQGCGLQNKKIESQIDACVHDTRAKTQYALIGDSKAKALAPGLMANSLGWTLIGGTSKFGAPTPVLSDDILFAKNQPLSQAAVESIAANKDIRIAVLTMSTRGLYGLKNDSTIEDLPASPNGEAAKNGLNQALKLLIASGKKIIITIDNPTLPDIKNCLIRSIDHTTFGITFTVSTEEKCAIKLDRHLSLSNRYRIMMDEIRKEHPKTVWIYDPTPTLCDTKRNTCELTMGDQPLYSFTDHVSVFASNKMAKDILKLMEEIEITNNQ